MRTDRASFSRSYRGNLPSSFNILLSSALVYSTSPPVSVLVRSICWCYFPGVPGRPSNPVRKNDFRPPSHSNRFRNINLIAIDYAFRPRLRNRLTLRGLTLRRNPWAFGDRVSHPVCRYSCLHSHFRYLHHPLRDNFAGLRNAPLPLYTVKYTTLSFGV